MLSYCWKCIKNTEIKNLKLQKQKNKKNGKIMLSSNSVVSGSKK